MAVSTELQTLIDSVRARDLRSVARAISLVENNSAEAAEIIKQLFPLTGAARVIGVTGAPGSGKSTLVDRLALAWRAHGKSVAVVAVDPSSPFSGGAVLGDRIRMTNAIEDKDIYIRSIATRGALGGLSKAASDVVSVLDAAGFDVVLVETVGVGQAEVDIVSLAETCLVVMVPGLGDSVQAIKAGVLEIADIFVVNKSDKDGADLVFKDIRSMLSLVRTPDHEWTPSIIKTVATTGAGTDEVIAGIEAHRAWLRSSGAGNDRLYQCMKESILQRVRNRALVTALEHPALDELIKQCLGRTLSPLEAAERLLS